MCNASNRFRLLTIAGLALALAACGNSTVKTSPFVAPDTSGFPSDLGSIDSAVGADVDAGGADGSASDGDAATGTDQDGTITDDSVDSQTTGSDAEPGFDEASGCKSDADCAVGGTTPTCKKAVCDTGAGKCSFVDASDGTSCDDASLCTTQDACVAGSCTGTAKVCDDANPCTDDACDATKGCTTTNNAVQCDDKDSCTNGDACADGVCAAGKSADCSDGNPCTVDTCDPKTGCKNANLTGDCDDGNACTTGDKCAEGVCVPGAAAACDDGNACTDDACNPKTGCEHKATAAGTSCNDGDACTSGDACADSKCAGATLTCDDQNSCTTDTCDKTKGCANTNTDGAPCDDGNTCTSSDKCTAGACAGTGKVCNDSNVCTDDSCKDNNCIFAANTAACEDGNPCTQGDQCDKSACAGGKPIVCDDKNVCTTDVCDTKSGTCTFTNNAEPCDDGSLCTTGDVCAKGSCVGTDKKCDDGKPCTVDACDDKTGACKSVAYADGTACDDGTVCTQKDACTAGLCAGTTLNCDDANPCTTDSCDATKGCQTVANTAKCDDANACTVGDVCKDSACQPGSAPQDCDDKNACTTDKCDPVQGCAHENTTAVCDDGNACTTSDVCTSGTCGGAAKNCDDGKVCTNDSCDAKTGCVFANNTALCSDGNVCTSDDTCKAGACVGTPAIKCDDQNPCTNDTCDAKTGCVFAPLANATKCDDGNGCTTGDACTSGKCGGVGLNCDDNNPCTVDSCANNTCAHAKQAAGTACNDGSYCTIFDVCDAAAACKGKPKCVDGNACTNDVCDAPATVGICSFPNNTAACDDGKFCTDKDTCAAGKCAGAAKTCDDANSCTNDSCDAAASKCVNAANTAKCNDNNACTVGDVCTAGACKAGVLTDCNDDNPCTADSCDKANGLCVNTLIVGQGACPIFGVPAHFPIDNADPLWFGASSSPTVKWQTDATPGTPGKLTGAASLNFNNGTNFADGSKTVSGTATGAFRVDATKVQGALLTLVYYSYGDVEFSNGPDKRSIEFSIDGFKTTVSMPALDNGKNQGKWYMETVNVSQFIGKTFQVRFKFDSVDGVQNGGKGWFVDDVNIYAGPVVNFVPTLVYTEKFEDNGNGWQFSAATGGVSWAIDATPAAPGAFQSKASLNFNNGTNFATTTAVAGNALAPVLNFEGVPAGSPITLIFKEWIDVEKNNSFDRRYVLVSGDAFASMPLANGGQFDNTTNNAMKTWRWNSVNLSQFAGKKVRLAFRFDSIDQTSNDGAGWFIDEAQIDVRPVPGFADLVSCGNASAWTIAKTGTNGTANWAVDNTGIAAFSQDCSLNFNAPSATVGKFDYACKAGSKDFGSNVAGTATSPQFVVPKSATAGAQTLLSFMAYSDVELFAGADKFTVTVKDVGPGALPPKTTAIDKSASQKTWKEFSIDISAYANRPVVLVFGFDSVDCIGNGTTGVAIDNVMVRPSK